MRAIDLTQPGGFPLTQDWLDHLQQAYTECINAFAAMGSDGTTPAIISGMAGSVPSPGNIAVTDGWFFFNGELIKFIGNTITPTGTDVALVSITPVFTTLTYNDGSTHPAVSNKTATLTSGTSATTGTQFPYSDALPYQVVFGRGGREAAWNNIPVATSAPNGSVTGAINYRKNWMANTLQIQATLTVNSAQTLPASPSAGFITMASLPSGYLPNTNAYFTSYYYASNLFKDDLGVSWVKEMTSGVNTGGQLFINLLRPESAITAYSVVFNTVIPLD